MDGRLQPRARRVIDPVRYRGKEPLTTLLHLLANPSHFDQLLGQQLDAFRAFGYDVVTASAPGERSKAFAKSPMAHHSLTAVSEGSDIVADVRAASQLRALLKEVEPDIVHTHDAKMGVAGRILGKRVGVPIVVNSVHEHPAQGTSNLAHRVALARLERVAAANSDAEFVRDDVVAEALRSSGIPDERIHQIGSGIDLDTFSVNRATARAARCLRLRLGLSLRTLVVTVVADLVWEEGYGEFFDAIEILRGSFGEEQLAFVVAGSRPRQSTAVDEESLTRMAQDHGVHFLDESTDASTVLAMTDVCVVPTLQPAVPNSAMAASAMGVPVVATDLPGCRSVIDHQETGLLVRPHKPQHLALTIERMLHTPPLRSELGRAGRVRAIEEFDESRVVERTLKVYGQLLERSRIPVPDHVIELDQPWYADSIDLVDRPAETGNREF